MLACSDLIMVVRWVPLGLLTFRCFMFLVINLYGGYPLLPALQSLSCWMRVHEGRRVWDLGNDVVLRPFRWGQQKGDGTGKRGSVTRMNWRPQGTKWSHTASPHFLSYLEILEKPVW